MISCIGIIYQGANDKGFLMGLRDRLGCEAEVIWHEPNRGKNKLTRRREADYICSDLLNRGAQLVVRLTDAGEDPWHTVRNEEHDNFPASIQPILICGAVPGEIECWLSRDRYYLEAQFGVPASQQFAAGELTGRVKSSLRSTGPLDWAEAVRSFVKNAPATVFRRWLEEPSFKSFYEDCRNAAMRENDCPINDELRGSEGP